MLYRYWLMTNDVIPLSISCLFLIKYPWKMTGAKLIKYWFWRIVVKEDTSVNYTDNGPSWQVTNSLFIENWHVVTLVSNKVSKRWNLAVTNCDVRFHLLHWILELSKSSLIIHGMWHVVTLTFVTPDMGISHLTCCHSSQKNMEIGTVTNFELLISLVA